MGEPPGSSQPEIEDPYQNKSRGRVASNFLRIFSSFRYPAYRMYFYSNIGHWAPMQMQMFARTLLIYRLTDSGTIIGLMSLANSIPLLLLSLYGGALADRVDKRQMLFWSQFGSGVLALGVSISLATGYLGAENEGSWWILIVSSGVQGILFGLMMPARFTIMPEIVESKDLMNAISLNNMGMNVFRIVSPVAAAFIVAHWEFTTVYYVMTALFFASLIFVMGLPKMPARQTAGGNPIGEIIEGIRYTKRETVIMLILLFTLACTVLGQPLNMLLPMFTDNPDLIGGGEVRQGWIMTVSGVGAIIISLILASISNKKRGLIMLYMGFLLSASLIVFSFNTAWIPALIVSLFIGIGQTGQMAIGTTLVQYHVDPAYRGRVMSFLMLGFGLTSLGTVFGGALADAVGVQWSIGSMALVLAAMSLLILVFGKRLRQLD